MTKLPRVPIAQFVDMVEQEGMTDPAEAIPAHILE